MLASKYDVVQPLDPPQGATRVDQFTDLDLTDTATFVAGGPPHAAFDALRESAPVAWHDEASGGRRRLEPDRPPAPPSPGFWVVTSHALVDEVSKHPDRFSSFLGGSQLFNADEVSLAGMRLMMLNIDPPDQGRLRRIVAPSFSPRAVKGLVEYVEAQAAAVAAEVAALEGEHDFVQTVSKELTSRVLAELLGLPFDERHKIVRWSDSLIGFEQEDHVAETDASRAELFEYGFTVLAQRRSAPGDDLMSLIAQAEIDGERLTDDEFLFFWMLLIIAGNETTRNTISSSVQTLLRTGEWSRLVEDPSLLTPHAVEELIRLAAPVTQFRRTAMSDQVLGGQRIRAGDKVVLYYPAANRDPAVFADPHAVDLTRDPNPHLAFGVGPHFCLGTRVARLQISAMLAELLRQCPTLTLAGDPAYTASTFISGIDRLPVRLA